MIGRSGSLPICSAQNMRVQPGASNLRWSLQWHCRHSAKGRKSTCVRANVEDTDVTTIDPAAIPTQVASPEEMLKDLVPDPSPDYIEVMRNAQEAIPNATVNFQDQIGQAWGDSTEAIAAGAGIAAEQFAERAKDINSGFSKIWSEVLSSFNNVNEVVGKQADSALDFANSVKDGTYSSLMDVQDRIQSVKEIATQQIEGSIPPEVLKLLQPLVDHPAVVFGIVGVLVVTLSSIKLAEEVFPDTSTIPVDKAVGLLNSTEPSLLIDLRSEDEQEECGIPNLSKGALGKGASVDAFEIPSRQVNMLKNAKQLESRATALFILEQKQASILSNIILMTSGQEDCRPIRDALRSLGCSKVFILEDGFNGWLSAGLPILQGVNASYSVGVLDSISDSAQALVDDISPIRSPSVYVPLAFGLALGLWATVNYKIVLRFFGVLGLLGTAFFFLADRYETPKAMLDDILQLLNQGYTFLTAKLQSFSGSMNMPVLENAVPNVGEEVENADNQDAQSNEDTIKETP